MFEPPLAGLASLSARDKAVFKRAGLVVPSEVLLPTLKDLRTKLRPYPPSEVSKLVEAVARGMCPAPICLGVKAEGAHDHSVLSFLDEEIDSLLGGGVRTQSITEICGESSAGKSQLCLLLALSCQLPNPSSLGDPGPSTLEGMRSRASVVYLSSEGKVPSTRLSSFADGLLERVQLPADSEITAESLCDNIHVLSVIDLEALDHTLSYAIPSLIARLNAAPAPQPPPPLFDQYNVHTRRPPPPRRPPLRLIVLDSLAALVRANFSNDSSALSQRSHILSVISDKLKSLAAIHNLAIVLVNQVSDVFNNPWSLLTLDASYSRSHDPVASAGEPRGLLPKGPVELSYRGQAKWFNGSTRDLGKEASLGLVWANAVNTRVMLSRTQRYRLLDGEASIPPEYLVPLSSSSSASRKSLVRRIALVFSPFAGPARADFVVEARGVLGLPSASSPPSSSGAGKRKRPSKVGVEDDPSPARPFPSTLEAASPSTRARLEREVDEVDVQEAAAASQAEPEDDEDEDAEANAPEMDGGDWLDGGMQHKYQQQDDED